MNILEFEWTSSELSQMTPLNQVDYLVIHHTASSDVSAVEIDQWHKDMGWIGIGYHYLIRSDGSIEKGRPDNKQGAHALGYNHCSLGIALTGNFMEVAPTPSQLDALEDLLTALRITYPDSKIVRHNELDQTACPGDLFPWDEFMTRLESPNWKEEIMLDAKEAGLISGDHNPDDPAEKWFVLATELKLLRKLEEMIG